MFLFSACEDKHDKILLQNNASFLSFKELQPNLNDNITLLLEDASWLTPDVMTKAKSSAVSIKEIQGQKLAKSAVSQLPSQIKIDKLQYDVKLELFNKTIADLSLKKLNKGDFDNTYGILLDPDQFYANDTDDEISLEILKSDNSTETIILKNPDYEIDRQQLLSGVVIESVANGKGDERTDHNKQVLSELSYPVFLVTLQQVQQLPPPGDEPPPPPSPTLYPWLEIRYINVLRKHDSGDEEFELYVGASQINPTYYTSYSYYADMLFNGDYYFNPPSSRGTIYERKIYINNVNDESDTFDPPVLISRLYSNVTGFATGFIESDYEDGITWKSPNYYIAPDGYYAHQELQYYKWLPTGANGPHKQLYARRGSADNNDDIYYGELLGINEESVANALASAPDFWLPAYYNGLGQLITDLKVRYGRGYYPYSTFD